MNQAEPAPLVSIGLAVYNGEDYLEEAIRSILAQTYPHFELIISDNASTDRTAEICQHYAEQDARIRYSRNKTNIGGVNNENLTARLARGKYFRLAAHDDICAPDLIEQCVAVLEQRPDVVLCYSSVVEIDERGEVLRVAPHTEGMEPTAFQRFRQLSSLKHWCEATYGLIRTEILRKTRLQLNYTGSDRLLLCELAFHGQFYSIPRPLFYKRFHSGNEYKDWQGRMAVIMPELQKTGKITFPAWIGFLDHFVVIGRAPISLRDKALCYLWMGPWLYNNWRRLFGELRGAARLWSVSVEQRKQWYAESERWA